MSTKTIHDLIATLETLKPEEVARPFCWVDVTTGKSCPMLAAARRDAPEGVRIPEIAAPGYIGAIYGLEYETLLGCLATFDLARTRAEGLAHLIDYLKSEAAVKSQS